MKDTVDGALFAAFFCLVETLDKRGALSVADLATSVGNTLDFRQTQKDFAIDDHSNLKLIYEHLLAMEKHSLQIASLKAQISSGPPANPPES